MHIIYFLCIRIHVWYYRLGYIIILYKNVILHYKIRYIERDFQITNGL